ncbi:MAG TPA: hypothetical protein VHB48_21660 [Chitinophagaceae bacterium]|nr:hypothetical protein [Chitinophagaceae bacterium]
MFYKKIANPALLTTILLSCFLLESSCTKTVTKTITDTVQHAWQPVPIINFTTINGLAGTKAGDSMFIMAGNTGYVMMPVNSKAVNSTWTQYFRGSNFYSPTYGFPYISSNLCTYTTANSLWLESVPAYSQYSIFSYTPAITPGWFSQFPQVSNYPSAGYPSGTYPVIKSRYLLVPAEADTGFKNVRFDLLSFDSAKVLSPSGFGDTPHVKSFYLHPNASTIGFTSSNYFCAVYYNKFFVSYGGQFFRIDTLGNVKSFGYYPAPYPNGSGIYNMFTVGSTLFARNGGIFFSSGDQGESWNVFNDFSGSDVASVIFRNVGDGLYATAPVLGTQIFKVALDGHNLNFSELNNDGLEYSLITSVIKCGKFVYVTTPTGVYYRDTTYFDQLKAPIR